jgi:hypothetical protein
MKSLSIALLVLGVGAGALPLRAASIAIINPSFEADTLACAPGCSTTNSITGWTGSSPGSSGFAYGVYKPGTVSYAGGVPNGVNVAYLLEDGPSVSIAQTLTANLLANDTYTLTFDVGLRSDTGVFAPGLGCYGFNILLEAGGNVLNSFLNSHGTSCGLVSTGSFTQLSVIYTSGAAPVGLGSPLQIVLTANGSGSAFEPGEIDFDQIALSDSTVAPVGPVSNAPEPEAFGVTLAGLLCLAWRATKRAKA